MPSLKSDITIIIKAGAESFSIGGVRMINNKFLIKRGRSRSEKTPTATLTEIFTAARKWAVKHV